VLTTAHLSRPEPDESSPQPHYTSWRIILILFSHQAREKCLALLAKQIIIRSCGRGGGEHKRTKSFDGETCGKQLEDLRHTWKNTKTDKYIG